MSSTAALRPLPRSAREWLIHLADPLGRARPPGRPLRGEDLGALLAAAELHGVLPAALRGLRKLAGDPGDVLASNGGASAMTVAREKLAMQAGIGLMLDHHGRRVAQALKEVSVEGGIIKGAVAARRLYSEPFLRTFSDVDILIRTADRDRAADVLRDLGFELFTFADRVGKDYEEDKWLLKGDPKIMIELHCNLVHSPKLRTAMSVRYEDALEAGDGDGAAATALLFVAGVHAAIGHQFDRLQHLVDILQAARGAAGVIEVARLRRVARRSGVLFAVVTAIELAGRTFDESLCTELACQLDRTLAGSWRRLLVTPDVVAAAQSRGGERSSWRRKLYRQCVRLEAARYSTARSHVQPAVR
jgi:hypothetical protein